MMNNRPSRGSGTSIGDGTRQTTRVASLDCHLFGHPQAYAPSHKPEPNHEVVRPVALKLGDGIPEQARVDEEGRDTRDRVMLGSKVLVRPNDCYDTQNLELTCGNSTSQYSHRPRCHQPLQGSGGPPCTRRVPGGGRRCRY